MFPVCRSSREIEQTDALCENRQPILFSFFLEAVDVQEDGNSAAGASQDG